MSLFDARVRCLNISRRPLENWGTSRPNSKFERVDFQNISCDEIYCLLYVCGLTSREDADVQLDLKRIEM